MRRILASFTRGKEVAEDQRPHGEPDEQTFKKFFEPNDTTGRSFIIPDLCIDILSDVSQLVPEVELDQSSDIETLQEAHRLGEADEARPQAFTGGKHSAFEFCKFFTTQELDAILEVNDEWHDAHKTT